MPSGDSKSDHELVRRLQSGDTQALGSLYDRHNQKVYQTAAAITGDPEVAGDILQDVFLRLFRYSSSVDPDRPLEPWLYRVAANLCYTWLKSRRRLFRPLDDITDWISGNEKDNPSHEMGMDEDWMQVQNNLSALPVGQRMVVVMYYLNDLSIEEISAILNVPRGTVKSRLHYGREALKKSLMQGTPQDAFASLGYEFT